MPTALETYLTRQGLAHAAVQPLSGDASTRQYVRVTRPDAPPAVVAIYPEPFDPATLPFLNVTALFSAIGAPIPAVRDVAGDLGLVVLEDLGDETLQTCLESADAPRMQTLYEQAVALIVLLQRGGAEQQSPRYQPYGLAFDVEKLTWELDFFAAHFLGDYRRAALSASERRALAEEWQRLAAELAAERRVLCHRDYHSRNLMVREGRLTVIDFQDARMGPDTYDLVSLLRDSYVELPDRLVQHLMARFLGAGLPGADPAEFRRRFDVMAMQRNLKALGTFGYQVAVRGKAHYAESVPRTLAYVRATAGRQARFGRLRDILAAHLPELR